MKVAVLAFNLIDNDSRVLRTTRSLHNAGYEVHLIAYGTKPSNCSAQFHSLGRPPTRIQHWQGILTGRVVSAVMSNRLQNMAGPRDVYRRCRAMIAKIRPDVVHANDWPTLPIAEYAKGMFHAQTLYDSHELAVEEHSHSRRWRLVYQPYVARIEGSAIKHVDHVITVSDGLAALLQNLYKLPDRPTVIANFPEYADIPVRASKDDTIEVLYHGLIAPNRGLESAIRALVEVHRPLRLIVRGHGKEVYKRTLYSLADRIGVAKKISFEPSASPECAVKAAAQSDIGIFVPPILSRQADYMLPNKIFEYVMARLMVIAPDTTEIGTFVNKFNFGIALESDAPSLIARTLSELTLDQLLYFKHRADNAARELRWDTEEKRLLAIYRQFEEKLRSGR